MYLLSIQRFWLSFSDHSGLADSFICLLMENAFGFIAIFNAHFASARMLLYYLYFSDEME